MSRVVVTKISQYVYCNKCNSIKETTEASEVCCGSKMVNTGWVEAPVENDCS